MTQTGLSERTAAPAAVRLGERALAPDLGRGFMLLAIALAHAHLLLYVADFEPTRGDQAAAFLRALLVDDRARPMFFFLFGYGLVQLTSRLEAGGGEWRGIRSLLRRRGWWLVVIGFAHAAVIGIDIVSAYGFALVIFVGLLARSDRALLWIAFCVLLPVAAYFYLFGAGLAGSDEFMAFEADMGSQDPAVMATMRLWGWVWVVLVFSWQVLPGMLLGVWAARRRMLEEPDRHRRALRRAAVGGIGLAVAGGLPWALMSGRLWTDPSESAAGLASAVHTVSGLGGGIGAIAVIGLIAIRIGAKRGPVVTAITALGQRSLTFYMFQSVVFLAVFAPFAIGLGGRTGFVGAALVAIGTWLLSVLLAEAMRRRGHRGPAEILLRRLTYGRR